MRNLSVLGALLALLFLVSTAEAFGPVRHAAVVRSSNHLLLGHGTVHHNNGLLFGHGTLLRDNRHVVLTDRGSLLRQQLFRDQLLLGRGTAYGVGAAPLLLRDQGCISDVNRAAGLYGGGLNSCAPVGNISPSLNLRFRVN